MPMITGVVPTQRFPEQRNSLVQAPLAAGTGWVSDNYRLTEQQETVPVFDDVEVKYSGRFDDVGYYCP